MRTLIQRLLGFDRLLGPLLVKLVFYFGAVVIAGMVCIGIVVGLLAIVSGNFGSGAMQLLAAPTVGAVAFVYWRFLCELFILAFLAYERLGEVRDLMRIAAGQTPSAPDPNHPEF
ncbi:MAG: DUF4282 domain-containing protein [Hyphomonadaceae bacterium]